jgi:hypothetical protein
VIRAAPWSFAIMVAVVIVAVWWAVTTINATSIATKDATIENLRVRTESLSEQIRKSVAPSLDIEATLVPLRNELEETKRKLADALKERDSSSAALALASKSQPPQPITTVIPQPSPDASAGEYSLTSTEALKRSAFGIAQEIEDFWIPFHDKILSIKYGSKDYFISSSDKANKVEEIENDASEQFKLKIAKRYMSIQNEIKNRSKTTKSLHIFNQAPIDFDAILSYADDLRLLAKELDANR